MVTTVQNQPVFNVLLDKTLHSVLSPRHFLDYSVVTFHYGRALSLAKSGKIYLSGFYLREADRLLTQVLCPVTNQWILIYALPKKAFYFFQVQDYTTAGHLSEQAIHLCMQMQKSGYDFLFHAGIQQRFNLARVKLNSGMPQMGLEACSLCLVDLIRYVGVNAANPDNLELGIRNIYQVVIKTFNFLQKKAQEPESCFLLLSYFLKDTLSLPGTAQFSDDPRYVEMISFLHLFSFVIDRDFKLFRQTASRAFIHDEFLRKILQGYLGGPAITTASLTKL